MPTLAPQQNRPAGAYTSSEVAAPARGQNQATEFRITLQPVAADLADTGLTIDTTLEGSVDGGANWTQFAAIAGWQGGMVGRDGNIRPPTLSWMATDNRTLTRVRVRWTQNKSARLSVDMEFLAVDIAMSSRTPG
jgi:hypothetical protein